jgi:hypothetical protein
MAIFSSGATLSTDGQVIAGVEERPPAPPAVPGDETLPADAAGEPADSEPPAPADDAASEEEAALSDQQPRANRPFVARTIRENERLRREHAAQAAQIDYLTRQLTQSSAPPTPTQPAPVQPSPSQTPRPRADAFQSHEEYIEALTDWKLDQREQQRAQHDAQTREATARQTAQQQWAAREAEGRDTYDDYDEVVSRLSLAETIAPLVADTFRESDVGAALLYYLGQHPKEVSHLNSLPPLAAARWLGQLELRVGMPPAANPPPRRAPATSGAAGASPPATTPMRPVGTGGTMPLTGFRPGMLLGDYERMRLQERGNRP